MGVIAALAAVSIVGALWQGAGPSVPFVVVTAMAMAFVPTQALGVAVLGLMLVTTAAAIAAALLRKAHPFQALMFAAADGLAVWGLWLHHLEATTWQLPNAGGWGRGSTLIALAAVARLGAGLVPTGKVHSALGLSGWWIGVVLALWAGPPALPLFAVAAGIILASALMGSSGSSVLGFSGAAAAVAAGLGASAATVAGIAGAGAAMALGAPVLGLFGWAAIPASAASDLDVPRALATGLALPAVALVLAIATEGAIGARSRRRGGGVTGWLALGIGLAGGGVRATWLVLAGLLGFALHRLFHDDAHAAPQPDTVAPEPVLVLPTTLAAMAFWAVASASLAALWLRGMATDFL